MNLVDSSGWLEYFAAGPNAGFFAAAIEDPENLLVPSFCLYEVFHSILGQRSEGQALQAVAVMQQGTAVDFDAVLALDAARMEAGRELPPVSRLILATARRFDALLWTQDADFEGTRGVRYVACGEPAAGGPATVPSA